MRSEKLLMRFDELTQELHQLRTDLGEFNIFRAIGVIRQELRHSDFLAFLLNPNESHGLGIHFLKALLQAITLEQLPSDEQLQECIVEREREHIDLLIYTPDGHFVLLIENKVFSSEHSNQLLRYFDSVNRIFKDIKIFKALFLSPEGIEASENKLYEPISYFTVINCLRVTLDQLEEFMLPDVKVLIHHYIAMIERYIVTDPEIIERCQQIYRDYKVEIELIINNAPDMRNAIKEYCTQLIEEHPNLIEDVSEGPFLRFLPHEWDIKELKNNESERWTNTKRMLLFEINVEKKQVTLQLTIGPDLPSDIKVNQLMSRIQPFFKNEPLIRGDWKIYKRIWLQQNDMLQNFDYIKSKIDDIWHEFIGIDLPDIIQSIDNLCK